MNSRRLIADPLVRHAFYSQWTDWWKRLMSYSGQKRRFSREAVTSGLTG